MKIWRLFYKIVLGLTIVLLYFLTSAFIFIFPFNKYKRKRILAGIYGFAAVPFIKILGIKAEVKGVDNYSKEKTWYIMSNHVSFTDILILITKFRAVFITSLEMRKRPLLGQLCVMAGCLFVDRKKITTLKNEIPEISGALKSKVNVCLFPESTCGNGVELLPFKAALMSAVSDTPAEILPVCIMYRKINGNPFTANDFPRIGYFGGMKFVPQFIKLLTLKSLRVEIEILKPFAPGNLDRKEIRAEVYERISMRYYSYLSEIKNN